MHPFLRRFASMIFLVALAFCTSAQASVRFQRILRNDGLPATYMLDIAQDRQGFIWFADVGAGLIRFDGYDFRTYRHDPANPFSISSNEVKRVYFDPGGNMWVATSHGLNRHDPRTDRFARITTESHDPAGLSDDATTDVLVDSKGRLWVCTGKGVNRLDPGSTRFRQYHVERGYGSGPIAPDSLFVAFEDSGGRIWFGGARGGGLLKYNPTTDSLDQYVYADSVNSPPMISIRSIAEDRNGKLWIAGPTGLSVLSPETMTFERIHFQSAVENANPLGFPEMELSFWSVVEDKQGYVWATTQGAGVFRIAPDRKSWVHLHVDRTDDYSLAGDFVSKAFVDRSGIVWLSNMGNLSRYNPLADTTEYLPVPAEVSEDSLVMALAAVGNDRIAAGTTQNGAWIVDLGDNKWARLPLPATPGTSNVRGLWSTPDGAVWVSTGGELNVHRVDMVRGSVRSFRQPVAPWAFHHDRHGNYWFGSGGGGLVQLDLASGKQAHWMPDDSDPESLGHQAVFSIFEDSANRLWIGTYLGVDRMDSATGKFTHFNFDPSKSDHLPAGTIKEITEDDQGHLWINSDQGISTLVPESNSFENYAPAYFLDGAVNGNKAVAMNGKVWWAATTGLISFDVSTRRFRLFDMTRGVETPITIAGMPDGRIALAYSTYLGIFSPDRLAIDSTKPPMAITRVSLGNGELGARGKDEQTGLDGSPWTASELLVPYGHAPLVIEFAALHFAAPEATRYSYRLEGLESQWSESDAKLRRATYTNLPPGQYVFRVKAALLDGAWNDEGISLNLTVLPPWWRTWWAYVTYVLAAALLLLALVNLRTRTLKIRANRLEVEVAARTRSLAEQKSIIESQALHLEQLMQTKDRMTTRISHEFRTPLTVILGPIDRLIARTRDEDLRAQLDAIKRNGSRLLRLVNQMLGLARLRSGRAEDARPVRVAPIVRQVVASFESLARERRIDLGLGKVEDPVVMATDDALEKIVVNLVSNAIKYSTAGASIRLEVTEGNGTGTICVSDTGRGIEAARLSHIFEPFERGHDEAERIPGSGIGLALVHELATAYHGRVQVESELGRGSTFRVSLPAAAIDAPVVGAPGDFSEEARLEVAALRSAGHGNTGPAGTDAAGHSILLIEDNPDMRGYLRQVLADAYSVDFAEDGEAGLRKAYATIPDLIVCDIMLPGKDGYDVCHALKSDARTSHIPVIMLTALEGHDERLKGLAEKADDYLTKPFDEAELRQRIANLLDLRAMLQRRYARDLQFDRAAPAGLSGRDQQFLQKLSSYVGRRYADPDLDLAAMASALAVSERNLQRKLKALVGLSPGEYLRGYRLQRAMERLLAGERPGNVAEAVGFASQAYFSTCFRAQFGVPPSEARERGGKR